MVFVQERKVLPESRSPTPELQAPGKFGVGTPKSESFTSLQDSYQILVGRPFSHQARSRGKESGALPPRTFGIWASDVSEGLGAYRS